MFILNPVICKMYVCVIACELDLGRKLSKIIAIQICIAEFLFFIILEYELDLDMHQTVCKMYVKNGPLIAKKHAKPLAI